MIQNSHARGMMVCSPSISYYGNNYRCSYRFSSRMSTMSFMTMIIAFFFPSELHAYLGPTHCIKPGTSATSVITSSSAITATTGGGNSAAVTTKMGYSTYNHLLLDLIALSKDFQSGQIISDERLTFTICPNKIIDLDDSTLPLGYLPLDVPRTTLHCGADGSRSNNCIIRGGGKRNPQSTSWNTNREYSYKNNEFGILGGGEDNVAQIYIYGESAYEITLKGLTMDNSITMEEMSLYEEYVAQFGEGSAGSGGNGKRNEKNDERGGIRRDLDKIEEEDPQQQQQQRITQFDDIEDSINNNNNAQGGGRSGIQPAHRLTSIAVRGKGYGNDAGPRLITIEDCKFTHHQGYAILVSPGIQAPEMPMAPKVNISHSSSSSLTTETQLLGQSNRKEEESGKSHLTQQRLLNLLDDGAKYIPPNGQVTYDYDPNARNRKYLDGHRVKIINSDFINNDSSDHVAGLVTSAYSLTIHNCLFEQNSGRAAVFVYSHDAIVNNTLFVENNVEISTVIMQTPKGQGSKTSSSFSNKASANINNEEGQAQVATVSNSNKDDIASSSSSSSSSSSDTEEYATHIIERSCFLGSHVGMSNVLVTDASPLGLTQRENHVRGTEYTWASKCDDGAAEKVGNDCITTNVHCVGRCIPFTSEECLADRVVTSNEYEMFMSGSYSAFRQHGHTWKYTLGLIFLVVIL